MLEMLLKLSTLMQVKEGKVSSDVKLSNLT